MSALADNQQPHPSSIWRGVDDTIYDQVCDKCNSVKMQLAIRFGNEHNDKYARDERAAIQAESSTPTQPKRKAPQ